jgi:hypothetical protein
MCVRIDQSFLRVSIGCFLERHSQSAAGQLHRAAHPRHTHTLFLASFLCRSRAFSTMNNEICFVCIQLSTMRSWRCVERPNCSASSSSSCRASPSTPKNCTLSQFPFRTSFECVCVCVGGCRMTVVLKKNKTNKVQFVRDETAGDGKLKSKKASNYPFSPSLSLSLFSDFF